MQLPEFQGESIILRPVRRLDTEAIRNYANDPEVARYIPDLPHPYSMADARKWIATAQRAATDESGFHFGIEHRERREIIGVIGLRNVNRIDRNAETGYWVGRPFWRQGVAGQAIRLILKFAFQNLDLRRVYAVVHEANVGSVRLLEKVGFVREGVWRQASFLGGCFRNVYGFGILSEEYEDDQRR